MAWPARTWVTAELVTATIMNAYVRDPIAQLQTKAIGIGIGDTHGDVIPTGSAFAGFAVPWNCTIIGWNMICEPSGSIVVDIYKSTFAAAPPTISIAGSEKPSIVAGIKAQDLALSTWSPTINAGDFIKGNVDSVTGVKQTTVTLLALLA